jgi:Fic family protein
MKIFRAQFGENEFSRKNYLEYFKNISAPTASRDLKEAVDKKIISRKGEKRLSIYKYLK